MGFDVSAFKAPPQKEEFTKNGQTLTVWVNPDILSVDFLSELERQVIAEQSGALAVDEQPLASAARKTAKKKQAPPAAATNAQVKNAFPAMIGNGKFLARVLSKLIEAWDAEVVKGEKIVAIEPTEEYFLTLPIPLLGELFEFCTEKINPKQKTAGTSEDSTSQAGS